MAKCIIVNCNNLATNNLSVRLRREDTTAIWAPNTDAFICDVHAACGMTVDIRLTCHAQRTIETRVTAGGATKTRTTPINNRP